MRDTNSIRGRRPKCHSKVRGDGSQGHSTSSTREDTRSNQHSLQKMAVAWNPKRSLIVSCSGDKTVRLYSYYTLPISEETSDILLPDIDSPPPMKLVFTPSSVIPTGHTKTVRSVAWAPSGKTFATASFDSNIGIWEQEEDNDGVYGIDLELGESGWRDWGCVSTLEGHEMECKCVAYYSTGNVTRKL